MSKKAKEAYDIKLEELSKQTKELQQQNDKLQKGQTETASKMKQLSDETLKLREANHFYKDLVNKMKEERQRYNEEITGLEKEFNI